MQVTKLSNPRVAIFTTYNSKRSDVQNMIVNKWISDLLKAKEFPFVQVALNNSGKKLSGFMVELEHPDAETVINEICLAHGQTSYMTSDSSRQDTRIVYVGTGSSRRVGTLQMLPEYVAKRCRAYISIPNTGYNFVITNLEEK